VFDDCGAENFSLATDAEASPPWQEEKRNNKTIPIQAVFFTEYAQFQEVSLFKPSNLPYFQNPNRVSTGFIRIKAAK
jgi:hypothetical protein